MKKEAVKYTNITSHRNSLSMVRIHDLQKTVKRVNIYA